MLPGSTAGAIVEPNDLRAGKIPVGTYNAAMNRAVLTVAWAVAVSAGLAADLPSGQIIDRVTCAADPSQSYALFVPSGYVPSHSWPVIFAFDPGGRGRNPVERYRAAAERYGFVVADPIIRAMGRRRSAKRWRP